METLFMTEEDKSLIENLVMNGVNRALKDLPCIKHGEMLVELRTQFTNHCNNDKERREDVKVRFDYWKLVLTFITVTILILQFIKKV